MICVLAAGATLTGGPAAMAQNAAPAQGAVAPAGDIAVAVKGQQTLMLGGAPSRIAIGDPEVADVKVLPASGKRAASVLVYGKKAGTTQLQVWSGANAAPQVWNVRVSGPVQGVLAGRGVSGGANVDMAGDKAVLSGHAESQLSHQGSVSAAASAVGGERRGGPVHRRAGRRGPGRGQGGRGAAFRDEAGGHQLRRPQRSLGRHQFDHARWLHRAAGLQQVRAAGLGILAVL